jgi:hypothetical protein
MIANFPANFPANSRESIFLSRAARTDVVILIIR